MKLICYLSNGYPSIDDSIKMAHDYVEGGCDTIEVDFPSRDPYLEGELIAGRMAEALRVNDNYDDYMKGILEIKRQNPNTRLIVLAYENTVVEIGVEKYANFILDNGFGDIIYVGHKHPEVLSELISRGIKVSCYVQFHQPQDEVDAALAANGFVYVQAKPTTGNVNP
ncbi:MAG: tryptophan synthase subunit alpha, partial [Clostridia bacterium]